MVCALARTCNSATCKKWLWKDRAEARGETHCECGRPFTQEVYKPLARRAQSGPRAAAPKAKAKPGAKPKAKAKAKATAAPWRRERQDATSSSTSPPSAAYMLTKGTAAKAAADDVAMAEELLRMLRSVGRQDFIQWGESEVKRLQAARDLALPPSERLQKLREQRDSVEKERIVLEDKVATTEDEIYELERRLYEERGEVTDVLARLEKLDSDIEQVELQIPPGADAPAAAEPTPRALTLQLMNTQRMMNQLHGDNIPPEINAHVQAALTWLDQAGAAFDRARREREAQVDSDEKMARAMAEQEAKENSRESEDVDATGDGDTWEVACRGRPKKGKSSGKGWHRQPIPSPTLAPYGGGLDGPSDARGRQLLPPPPPPPDRGRGSRAASEPRGAHPERRRSPRRQQGGGTPAHPAPGAEGGLGGLPQPTVSPSVLPSAPPAAVPTGTSAGTTDDQPDSAVPAEQGQTGVGDGAAAASNSGGRPLLT